MKHIIEKLVTVLLEDLNNDFNTFISTCERFCNTADKYESIAGLNCYELTYAVNLFCSQNNWNCGWIKFGNGSHYVAIVESPINHGNSYKRGDWLVIDLTIPNQYHIPNLDEVFEEDYYAYICKLETYLKYCDIKDYEIHKELMNIDDMPMQREIDEDEYEYLLDELNDYIPEYLM